MVFSREDGSLIHPERLLDWFRQRAKAARLRPNRLHDLRHSYATALVQAGVPMKAISERLGHSGIGITMDVYSHVLRDLDQEAADLGGGIHPRRGESVTSEAKVRIERGSAKPVCPRCESFEVLPSLFGMPAFDWKVQQRKVAVMGCDMPWGDIPEWQ